MRVADEREVWKFSMILRATPEDAEIAAEALKRALCPDDSHPGPCPVPWTLIASRFEDQHPDDQRMWAESFDEEG